MKSEGIASIKYVYLLGIGGIGMSALARYFKAAGKQVFGYDKTPTPLTDELINEGIEVHFEDRIDLIPAYVRTKENIDATLVVLTPAIPSMHTELNFFRQEQYVIAKRSQVLGMLTADQHTLAVAGTHGKTTTSSILAHLLRACGKNCTAFLGGISVNYHSNLLLGDPMKPDHLVVVEADEFDRSFLTLFPEKAIITSMDADHLDIYGDRDEMQKTYRDFAGQVKSDGLLIHKSGLDIGAIRATTMTYSIYDETADYRAEDISVSDGRYHFTLVTPGFAIENLTLGLPGRHNIENAVAASAVAIECGVDLYAMQQALASYAGVKRRFEFHIREKDLVYLDDYAHHPEELLVAISSVRELYPDKKITGVFQPHLFSRTRDFSDGFASSLSLLDQLYMLEIYPARELPIPGVDSSMILSKIKGVKTSLETPETLLLKLSQEKPEILLTLGAGDIDQLVVPITRLLKTNPWK